MAKKKLRSHVMPVTYCPACLYKFDRASDFDGLGTKPKPGDATLCMRCAAILEFDSDLRPKMPSAQMLADIDADPKLSAQLDQGQRAIRRMWVTHPWMETQH